MMGPDRQLWAGILAHLKAQHPALCRQWFEQLQPLGLDGGVLRLRSQSLIQRDYLQRQCTDPFNDAARTVSKLLLSVQFFGPEDPLPASKATDLETLNGLGRAEIKPGAMDMLATGVRTAGHSGGGAGAAGSMTRAAVAPVVTWDLTSKPKNTTDSLVINPDNTFENFVVGLENRYAHAAAVAVSNSPGTKYNPYFVHGGVGLGKTHLLQAICARIKETNPGAKLYYTSCEGFMTQFIEAMRANEMSAFHHRFREVDVLVIDDIHFLTRREHTQEEFFHTFNHLFQQHKQLVLSSDAAPEDIPQLEARLISRFKWGLVTSVGAPSYETRVAILKNKALVRGFALPDDVACHIAAKIDSNIRELEGAVVKLQVLASVEKRAIDLSMAAAALGDEPIKNERQVQIQTIINAVMDFYHVKMTDLQSKRRQRSIAVPRQVCMYLARKHTRFSLEEIGGYFGGRDHTTVMHAVRTIEDRCTTDVDFGKNVLNIEVSLRGTAVG